MEITVRIPDEFAERIAATGDVERRVLEALALEEFKRGNLTRPELRRLLGFEVRAQLDEFLVSRGLFGNYTDEDLARDLEDARRAGI